MRSLAAGVLQREPRRSQPGDARRPNHRGELAAGLGTIALIAELLLIPLAVPASLVLVAAGRVSRWRLAWLLLPLLAGTGWLAAAGPRWAVATVTADPGLLISGLRHSVADSARLTTPGGAAATALAWLPRQLPIALVAGAVQAGLVTWLSQRRGGWSWRPGLIAAARRWRGRALLAAGQNVTEAGFAIGLDARTGGLAGLSWAEAERAGLWPPGTRAAVTGGRSAAPRGRFRQDLLYLGWQPRAEPDPGEPPASPPAVGPEHVSGQSLAAQRREHARLARPARVISVLVLATAGAAAGAWLVGWLPGGLALLVAAMAVAVAGRGWSQLGRARREVARQRRAEQMRAAAFEEVRREQQAAEREEYARQLRGWRQRAAGSARRTHWHPVTLPVTVNRLDVAGGTIAGWSALLATMAVARLAAGGEVTVVDLTGGGVVADLLAVARHQGARPLFWRLPADLPRLNLGAEFNRELLADVLARTVAATAGPGMTPPGQHDPAEDAALLRRVLAVLGDGATLAQLAAALRAVGEIGGPADHFSSAELTSDQLARLGSLAGRGAGPVLIERAWAVESRLQALSPLASGLVSQPASALRVAWLDSRAASLDSATLAAYLVIALAETLHQSRPGPRWQQSVFLLGAERLPADVLDRLCDATELTGTGLLLGYRSIPPHVRDRLGRGDAAVAFMRLGNAADARLAVEQIGTEHRFVISQLTDTVGASVSDTGGGSFTGTAGTAHSVADSKSLTETAGRSRGSGRSRAGGFAPFAGLTGSASRDASFSTALSDSRSVSAGINTATSWGLSTSRTVGTTGSVALAAQRARELLVEASELQQLPPSALVLCYPGSGGRQVLLADANPAIMALPTATLAVPAPDTAPADRHH